MPRLYSFKAKATTSVSGNKTLFNLITGSTARVKVRSITLYSVATPASANTEFFLQRTSADGTATSVTPAPNNGLDSAATSTVTINHSAEPTYTANKDLYSLGLYQPGTFTKTWAAGEEPVVDMTSGHGLGLFAVEAGAAYEVDCRVDFIEE